jgi:hypothetical protein
MDKVKLADWNRLWSNPNECSRQAISLDVAQRWNAEAFKGKGRIVKVVSEDSPIIQMYGITTDGAYFRHLEIDGDERTPQ